MDKSHLEFKRSLLLYEKVYPEDSDGSPFYQKEREKGTHVQYLLKSTCTVRLKEYMKK